MRRSHCNQCGTPCYGPPFRCVACAKPNHYNTREWKRLSQRVRAEQPYCYACNQPSTSTDHIVPLDEGGTNARSNLRGSCSLHNQGRSQRSRL